MTWTLLPFNHSIIETSTLVTYTTKDKNALNHSMVLAIKGTGLTVDSNGFVNGGSITEIDLVDPDTSNPVQTITLPTPLPGATVGTFLAAAFALQQTVLGTWGFQPDLNSDAVFTGSTTITVPGLNGTLTITGTGFVKDTFLGKVSSVTFTPTVGSPQTQTFATPISLALAGTALGAGDGYYTLLTLGANVATTTSSFFNELEGGIGNDTLVGVAAGNSAVRYQVATGAVTVDLALGTATGGGGIDKLVNITNLSGSAFGDTLLGNNSGNFIDGSGGNDTINGRDGGDFIVGGGGNDSIIGGAGFDTLILSGNRADYTITTTATGLKITDTVAGRDGIDMVTGVEYVRFTDAIMTTASLGKPTSLTALVPALTRNGVTAGDQTGPQAMTMSDGSSLLVYLSTDSLGATAIMMARTRPDYTAAGDDATVATGAVGSALAKPNILSLANGRFAVTWLQPDPAHAGKYFAMAQFYNADGTTNGSAVQLSPTSDADSGQFVTMAESNNHIMVTWTTASAAAADGSGRAIEGAILSASAPATPGTTFIVNSTSNDDQIQGRVLTLANGNFQVVFNSYDPVAGTWNVMARVFDSNGNPSPVGDQKLNVGDIGSTTNYSSFARVQRALLGGGLEMVVWESLASGDGLNSDNSPSTAIKYVLLLGDGTQTAFGERFVNTTTAGNQRAPTIRSLGDGRAVVVWQRFHGGVMDFQGVIVNADGTFASAHETNLITNLTDTSVVSFSVNVLKDNEIVLSWQGNETADADGKGISSATFVPTQAGDLAKIGLSGSDTIAGGAGTNWVGGASGNDKLSGGAGTNFLSGNAGDDTIMAGTGFNALLGGLGNDTFILGATANVANAVIAGGSGLTQGTKAVGEHNTIKLTGAGTRDLRSAQITDVDTFTFAGSAAQTVMVNYRPGMLLDTVINSGDAFTHIFEMVLAQDIGLDIAVDARTLTINGASNTVEFDGRAMTHNLSYIAPLANSIAYGGTGNDNMFGGARNDRLFGGDGNDTLEGADGNDILQGGNGIDTLSYFGAGSGVTVSLALTTAQAIGMFSGTDTVSGFENLLGSASGDKLIGSGIGNQIDGRDGSDTITGGLGADTLTGGLGLDVFQYMKAADGGDVITDFTVGQDLIGISKAGFLIPATVSLAGTGANNFAAHYLVVGAGAAATEAHGQFLYDTTTGALTWDSNGTGAGGSVLVATLTGAPTISSSDFKLS